VLFLILSGNTDTQTDPKNLAQGSSAYEGLQAAKQVLIRLVARRFESVLERLGQKLISRILQFHTSDRILFQQGPTHEWIAYTFSRQQLLTDDKGEMRSVDDRQKMYRDYKFLVTPNSSLALTRAQRTMAAMQLRAATGFAPSVKRILTEADLGDPSEMMREGIEELEKIPKPPPPKGRSGRR